MCDKILCKDDYYSHYFTNGKIYEINNVSRWVDNDNQETSLIIYIKNDNNTNIFITFSYREKITYEFKSYFYTPEETKNVLRTQLIDKILQI